MKRQKAKGKNEQEKFEHLKFRSTHDIIKAAEAGRLPDKMMINIHPQRWHDRALPWVRELVWQTCPELVEVMLRM